MKTGACRYGIMSFLKLYNDLKGIACKRIHIIPIASETILVEQMFRDSYNKMKNVTKGFDDSLLEVNSHFFI